jgi:hypothetical protein
MRCSFQVESADGDNYDLNILEVLLKLGELFSKVSKLLWIVIRCSFLLLKPPYTVLNLSSLCTIKEGEDNPQP